MRRYGLVGFPLSHSFSERWFNDKFRSSGIEAIYRNYPLRDPAEVRRLAIGEDLSGFNVTIPHKESIIPFLDQLDNEAEAIGAVNLVTVTGGGTDILLKGYNTDHRGFAASLVQNGVRMPSRALALGTGGSARAVCYALRRGGCHVQMVSRNPSGDQLGWEMLADYDIAGFDMVVNCTPVGMYPDTDAELPFPYQRLRWGQTLYDLIYNPAETLFLKRGKEAGCRTLNGLDMLLLQAEAGWGIWSGLNEQ
ncbi:MAG: shikimate dehydrogenase [Bacteroidales bacterium]